MDVLKSSLFTEGDPMVIKKLEDCATGNPSEPASHFRRGHVNGKGEHIKRVQQALKNAQKNRPELNIPNFDVNGIYDEKFARAIYAYKEKRDIRNYANKIDDIIGIKTIRSLDSDNTNRPHLPPEPKPNKFKVYPKAFGDCVPEDLCPFSTEFDVKLLFGGSAGEGIEGSKYYFSIRDTVNGLSALYESIGGGLGASGSPIGVADGGKDATHYSLKSASDDPCRVTDFRGIVIAGVTPYNNVSDLSKTVVALQYRPGGSGFRTTGFKVIDSGSVAIAGLSAHGNLLTLMTTCRGKRGAVKKVLTRWDVNISFF